MAATYLYNAYREPKENEAARSVYFFLAANALAVAGFSGYAATNHSLDLDRLRTSIGLGTFTTVWDLD